MRPSWGRQLKTRECKFESCSNQSRVLIQTRLIMRLEIEHYIEHTFYTSVTPRRILFSTISSSMAKYTKLGQLETTSHVNGFVWACVPKEQYIICIVAKWFNLHATNLKRMELIVPKLVKSEDLKKAKVHAEVLHETLFCCKLKTGLCKLNSKSS